MEWYNLFREHILNRGAEYHQDGYVTKFEVTEQEIDAEVEGSENYHVNIALDGENVIYMTCDCPHAESGNNCKYMAAVKIELEKKKAMDIPIAVYDRKTQTIYQQNSDGTRIVVAERIRKGRYSERIKKQA